MNNVQEALFQTIETIAQSKVSQLKFDKTIEAIVISDAKSDIGEYELKYQDLMFTAYSSNNTSKFRKDENVLVLIPDGDMSKRKTIISSNKREGEIYVDIEQVVDRVGINFVDEAENFKITLSTRHDETVGFNLKKQLMIDQYPGQKFLSIGAELYTNINTADLEGSYGLAIDCIFLNNAGDRIPHTFEFNTLNVTGNPYQARGYKETFIPLLEERLLEIVSARAFSKGFTAGNEDIKFKNIVVEYVNIREQDKSEYSGNIIAPKGTHFRSGSLYPDEKLQLIMEFKQRGQVLNTSAIGYKWFILNGEINSTDNPNYHPDAGFGWEWIRTGVYDESLIKGAGTSTLEIGASFVPSFTTFKCIADYADKDARVTDMITLVDHTDTIDIEIISDNGVSFVNGIGSTNLVCNVSQNGTPIDLILDYEWTQIKDDGTPQLIYKGPNNNISVSANTIGVKSTYTCEVSIKGEVRPIATGYITLINIVDGSTQGIVIVGGFRTVLYDGSGKAPTNLPKEGFQFDVYDNGEKVTSGLDWTWKIPPITKTLLTLNNAVIDINGNQTTKDAVLNLGVLDTFDISKNDNTISVEVQYTKNGITNTLRDFAAIAITKVGQNGADGAAGKPGLDGHTYVYEIQGGSPTITYDKNGLNPHPKNLPTFTLMFSVDGNTGLAKDVDSVEWNIQEKDSSVLGFSGKDKSIRVVTTRRDLNGQETNPHFINLVVDENWAESKFNNFISAKITYKDQIFRETYPISVIKNGSDGESGLTITTNPNSFNVETEADGNILNDVSILINFDIYRSNIKVENYRIISVGGVPNGMEYSFVQGNKLQLTFKRGLGLPDNGIIEIDLGVDNNSYRQTFTYTKTRNGDSPYLLFVQSTNGMVFKQGDISTVLYAIVMKGSENVTDSLPEEAFSWIRIDKDGNETPNWTPTYFNNQKDKIVITPQDVLERATFNCFLTL